MHKLLLLLFFPVFLQAQDTTTIDKKIKGLKAYPGFLPLYWDENTGKIFLEINQLDTEILYHTSLPAGLGSNDIGLDRGMMGETYVVKFSKVGNKILMTQSNYNFRALSNDAAERRAVEQSFAKSVIWGFTIESIKSNSYIVDATAFFLRDATGVVDVLMNLKQGNYSVDLSRSAMYLQGTKNFPLNTEVESTITFTTKDPRQGNFLEGVAPTKNALTLRMHHSFMQLPDNKYQPRAYDSRSGAIDIGYFDYSTPVTEPIEKRFIIRHRLEKKDPGAAMSDPVNPIVYYLDNGTPEPIRSALLDGAKWWNKAFEAAGYRNAFQVKILPDTADPMDLRYNMINWVHRSTRGWSYGAAVVDPRTGEIIKGNVSLGSLRVRQDYLIATGLLSPFKDGIEQDDRMLQMALQRLKQLSAHEIGHTIGFAHNYISSTQGKASVMDYPAPDAFINDKGEIDLSRSYTNEIGDWDKVTVAYSYQDFPKGTNEKEALNQILANAAFRGLTYISDRDARDPAGLHPSAHLWDNGKDAVAALHEVKKVREKALENFGENTIRKDIPYSRLEDALVPIYLYHRYQLEATVKLIGGMNYSYAIKGDGQLITKEIPKEVQKNALSAVLSCIAPSFLAIPDRITRMIPPRPSELAYHNELFNKKTGLSFDPLSAAESATSFTLNFLFHPKRLNRMVQFAAMQQNLGIDEMMNELLNVTWRSKRSSGLERLIQEQNELMILEYVLGVYNSNDASLVTKAAMLKWAEEIKSIAKKQYSSVDDASKGMYLLALEKLEKKQEVKPYVVVPLPPGAPIGCED